MRAGDVEAAVFRWAAFTGNRIAVPNISHSMLDYEADMIVVSKARYCTEVEIKVSRADLLADAKKRCRHGYNCGGYEGGELGMVEWIKQIYFAVPESLKELVPLAYGVLIVKEGGMDDGIIEKWREAPARKARPLTEAEYIKLLEMGCLRVGPLRAKVAMLKAAGRSHRDVKG